MLGVVVLKDVVVVEVVDLGFVVDCLVGEVVGGYGDVGVGVVCWVVI